MYQQITSNKRKSFALMFGFLVLYGIIAYVLSLWFGPIAVYIVAGVAIFMVLSSLFMGDDMAVRVAGGKQIKQKEEAPELWRMVENLSITAGLEMPRLFVSPDPSPNAFAAGRSQKQALICVNQGLLNVLDDMELQGVLAHEMAHIKNLDVRLMTYAAVLAGSIAMISQIILHGLFFMGGDDDNPNPLALIGVLATALLAPLAATIIQLAVSRKREYVADASGAELTRYPAALASALGSISGGMRPAAREEKAIAHMMIAPQLSMSGKPSKLFSTHPPTEDRIAKLLDMAGGVSHTPGDPVAKTFKTPFYAATGASSSASG